MSWVLTLIFLLFVINHYHPCDARSSRKKKVPSALVVGSVYCDTCFQNDFSKASHFIPGAWVAIECKEGSSKRFRKEVRTNKHGEFKVALPVSISKHVKRIEGCSIKLIRSSDPYCSVASTATSLHLQSRKPGTHIFSAGFFTFKPLTQPTICNQKPSPMAIPDNTPSHDHSFPPPLQDPPSSIIPPIDNPGQFQPIPILPRIPPFPQIPNLPDLPKTPIFPPKPTNNDFSNKKSFAFPPNPFQPPLAPNPLQPPLPPNPLQPPPSIFPPILPSPPSTFPPIFPSPPSIFPPIFPSPPQPSFPPIFPAPPSPPSLFPPIPLFPPLPFLTPPPSLPPPAFPLLPPFPFQPAPRFPGVPPAASLAGSKGSGP